MYYTYIIRCRDNSLYTGITNDLERRTKEHFGKMQGCAKYTMSHDAYKLEVAWTSSNKSIASKLEYHIKKDLVKREKEELIKNPSKVNKFLDGKLTDEEMMDIKKVDL